MCVIGTTLKYIPGIITGGNSITHACPITRSVGYFLEPLAMLAPFGKKALSITLQGVTNDNKDISVDVFRTVTIPVLRHFGIDQGVELKVKKRGAAPAGGGEVLFKCGVVAALKPITLLDEGRVKRIRGVAYVLFSSFPWFIVIQSWCNGVVDV
jgi:RNA 3'-terminal phosphate cyclase-like protein